MIKKILPFAWLLSAGLVLTGCGSSPPNNYYLLSAHPFPAPSGETPAVGIRPIEIPEYLSRQNLVYNRLDNSLQVASSDMWAEPLEDGIQRVLALNLAGLLNTQNVRFFPWHPKRTPDYGVKVNLLQLDANKNEASLTAEWLVSRPENAEPVNRRLSQLQLSFSSGSTEAEQVAATYSKLLFQLSEIIAAAITKDGVEKSHSTAP